MGKTDTDRAEPESLPKGGLFVRDFPVLQRFVNVCRRSESRDREFAASVVSVSHSHGFDPLILYIFLDTHYFTNFIKPTSNACITIGISMFASRVTFGRFIYSIRVFYRLRNTSRFA